MRKLAKILGGLATPPTWGECANVCKILGGFLATTRTRGERVETSAESLQKLAHVGAG